MKGGRERKSEREKGGRECNREEGEREGEKGGKGKERCPELLILFLKGMTGALAPFSYLVVLYSAKPK